MAPGTELARDFCTGIGPLQLGIVLVFYFYFSNSLNVKKVVSNKILTLCYCNFS